MAALVSASGDGGLLARVLELFRVQPVRGSSSRRGPQALRELTTWARRGFDLAITPDGPRGPCYVVDEGVIAAARELSLTVPLVVRLEGTNVEKGKEMLAQSGLKIQPATGLTDAAQKVVAAAKGI